MKNIVKLVVLGTMVLVLGACGTRTLSKAQCEKADWYTIGYNDGSVGKETQYIMEHQKSCGDVGIIPDFKTWKQGWEKGALDFCTENNVYNRAILGYEFKEFCEIISKKDLRAIHEQGAKIYQLKKEIYADRKQLNIFQSELKALERGEMLNFKTESAARRYMLQLHRKVLYLEHRIERNEDKLQPKYDKKNQTLDFNQEQIGDYYKKDFEPYLK